MMDRTNAGGLRERRRIPVTQGQALPLRRFRLGLHSQAAQPGSRAAAQEPQCQEFGKLLG